MTKTLKNVLSIITAVILIVLSILPCFAVTGNGKIDVVLEDKEKNRINGMTVLMCRIAELNSTGYYPTADFENSGISISGIVNSPDENSAKAVLSFVEKNKVSAISKTSENGKVSFSGLDLGIWLVYGEANGKYSFNPYIVFLPYESGGKLFYEISSAPKVDDNSPDEINVYVVKRWDDKNNAAKKRPDAVDVELLSGQQVVATASLDESNGWAFTFVALPKDAEYTVREKTVENYTPHYSGDVNNGFVITNSYSGEKLPQTGQYWWPIIVITVVGVCFVLLGIIDLMVKKNDKKK